MCDCCRIIPVVESRRSFLRKIACTAAAPAVLGGWPRLEAATSGPAIASPSWARLVTPYGPWNNHDNSHHEFSVFIRTHTPYQLEMGLADVAPSNPDRLRHFPVIFAYGLFAVNARADLNNLRNYLYNGGFLLADYCIQVLTDAGRFLRDHARLFSLLLPGAVIHKLEPTHPLFHPQLEFGDDGPTGRSADHPTDLYGVYDDDRLAALISLERLLCGWPDSSGKRAWSLRHLTEIYMYARSQNDPPGHV